MKYIKLFEEFEGLDPLEILPDGILLRRWHAIVWYSLDQGQFDQNATIPTSLDKIVVLIGDDEEYDSKPIHYMAYVATDEESKDPLAVYVIVRQADAHGDDEKVVARMKVNSFEEGIKQLVEWTDIDQHEITYAVVGPTRKLDITSHTANVGKSKLDTNTGSQALKMRKIGPNKSGKIAKWPINPN